MWDLDKSSGVSVAHLAQLVAMKESRNVQNKKERRYIWTIDQGAEDTAADNYKSGRAPGPSIPLTLSSAACFSAGGCLCCSNRRNHTQQPEQFKPGGMEGWSGAAGGRSQSVQASPELCFSAEQLLLVYKEHRSFLVRIH